MHRARARFAGRPSLWRALRAVGRATDRASRSAFVAFAAATALRALGCAPGGPRGTTVSTAGADAGAATPPGVIRLWPDGAPGSEARRHEPEEAKEWWVKNIHDPSLTAFVPPPGRSNGTAIIIAPGGGHRALVFNAEGADPARYLAALGVTAFALKYRLAREEGSTYDLDRDAGADIRRAMRLVRSRASEWGLDARRVGVMGWSAGGELASMVAYGAAAGNPASVDPIERASARPDFQIVIYPGDHGIPETIPPDAPPAFFLAANDDPGPAATITLLLEKYRRAGIPAEVHLYAEGHHAFNMGNRSNLVSIRGWPQRMADWLTDRGLLAPDAGAR